MIEVSILRKSYDKVTNINEMLDSLEEVIKNSNQPKIENEYFYMNHRHKELYLSLRSYFSESKNNTVVDAACYITAIPEVYDVVNIFDYIFPLDWIQNDGKLSDEFKSLKPHIQYIALAAAEASNIKFNTRPALSLGMEYWNIEQLKVFWQYTIIRRKNAM